MLDGARLRSGETNNMLDIFSDRDTGPAIPVFIVQRSDVDTWLATQSERMRRWVEQAGAHCDDDQPVLVRSAQGEVEAVVVRARGAPSMWDLATLPNLLPAGDYEIAASISPSQSAAYALGWALGSYRFDKYRTRNVSRQVERPRLMLSDREARTAAITAASATFMVRDMVNMPSSDMGPEQLEEIGAGIARRYGGQCHVICGDGLLAANYPLIHAVGRASTRQPRLIDLRLGAADAPKVTLVGKGVCFDSGGLSIKSFEEMLQMKIDMSGAAHAYALAQMIMESGLKLSLRVLVPAVENGIAGNAYRPLDILTSRKGLTVEVGSTDAEGRLILADALCEADRESPQMLIDFATLTSFEAGAGLMAAFFTHDEDAAARLTRLSRQLEDPIWRMPFAAELAHRLKGKLADLTNTGSIYKGSTLRAALFLSHFVEQAGCWVHVDLPDGNDEDRPGRPSGGEAFALRAVFGLVQERFGRSLHSGAVP